MGYETTVKNIIEFRTSHLLPFDIRIDNGFTGAGTVSRFIDDGPRYIEPLRFAPEI